MIVAIGREHGGPGGSKRFLRVRPCLDSMMAVESSLRHDIRAQKKPDASPYASMKVRPRTWFRDDRETPSRNGDTMLLLVFRTRNRKNHYKTWSVFILFWWSTAENELGSQVSQRWNPIPNNNLHPATGKSSRFSEFFGLFMRLSRKWGCFASRFAGGGFAASESSLALDSLPDLETRMRCVFPHFEEEEVPRCWGLAFASRG